MVSGGKLLFAGVGLPERFPDLRAIGCPVGLAIRPFFQVGRGIQHGELLEIRIQRAAGASLALILGSGSASMLILAVYTLAQIH